MRDLMIAVDCGNDLFSSPNMTGSPERRLLLAILERSLLDYVGNDQKEYDEANSWIFDPEDDGESHFTFRWICEQLDLSSDDVLETVKEMPRRGANRLAPWYINPKGKSAA